MVMSGQLYAATALLPGKELLVLAG